MEQHGAFYAWLVSLINCISKPYESGLSRKRAHNRFQTASNRQFVGLVNYSILALIQLKLPVDAPFELSVEEVITLFDQEVFEISTCYKPKTTSNTVLV